jgi:hypothetical protein
LHAYFLCDLLRRIELLEARRSWQRICLLIGDVIDDGGVGWRSRRGCGSGCFPPKGIRRRQICGHGEGLEISDVTLL